MEKSVAQILDERQKKAEQGNWFPASAGTEKPFRTRNNFLLLYVYQPATGRHAYLNVETDVILTEEEATMALGI